MGGIEDADARLRQLYPLLYRENPTNWSVIASHLPGSTGGECKRRWHALNPLDAPAAADLALSDAFRTDADARCY